ncbi:hypothetical protein RJ640_025470 [Escallonia rubra]|uniref:Zinc finger CCCH domain-containing protein 53-like n=1 Tax=Escallonia rubra TaxID=112253 RepID=A0AA88R2U1_9ASTE|nr:hypothetical protein RJ640_025470 [Escallonia rubra]
MDAYEATRIVFSRIQNLDPENASKIMGLLLIQDHGEKEMIRLAFGPESVLHSVILKARKELGVSSSNSPATPSTPSSPSPLNNPVSLARQNSSSSVGSSRLLNGITLPSPLSIPNPSSSWAAASSFADFQNPEDLSSTSSCTSHYTNFSSYSGISNLSMGSSSSKMNSSASPFYGGGEPDLIDELQLQDQLSFLNDGSPPLGPKGPVFYYPDSTSSPNGSGGDGMVFPPYGGGWGGNGLHHRRSCSVSEINLGSDDPSGGFGWKPCLYYARGYCKNGTSCRFVHEPDGGSVVGSPSKMEMMEHCQELLRSKSAHQQRLAAASQLMASGNFPYSASNKCTNFLLQQQNDSPRAAAALMMGEEMQKFGRSPRGIDRSEFFMNGGSGIMNPGSRQIYLTFPADSTFREEDVSNYFSIYGPVQDVRIPYQQKRMFGFVTFVYPETVKVILAKGNPHFVCDARVLVKPYKEKGKAPDKKQQQPHQIERGEFGACGSPTGLESRDSYDLGTRMFYNTQDLLWRRKLEEQADLQQALELQSRRLMSLQLLDVKRHNHHRALSTGAAIPSPMHSPSFCNQMVVLSSDSSSSPEVLEENGSFPSMTNPTTIAEEQQSPHMVNMCEKERKSPDPAAENGNRKASPRHEESDFQESLEHNLPDSLFASPRAANNYKTAFSDDSDETEKNSMVGSPSVRLWSWSHWNVGIPNECTEAEQNSEAEEEERKQGVIGLEESARIESPVLY